MAKMSSMARQVGTKINHLLKNWPHGTVAALPWLERQGITRQLVHEYAKTAWVERIGQGAYIKSGDQVEWQGALYAVQTHLKLPIHVAAKAALALHGIVHFVPLGKGQQIYLFGAPDAKLPVWFKKRDWGVNVEYVRSLFLSSDEEQIGLTEVNHGAFSIRVSSRERAILEICFLVPQNQQYDEAKLLMEGLQTLRPRLLQSLLVRCDSIKAKRLFLHLAESCNMPWLSKLDLSKIKLGSGKRSIAKGGVLDPKYQLIVPKIHEGGSDDPERP